MQSFLEFGFSPLSRHSPDNEGRIFCAATSFVRFATTKRVAPSSIFCPLAVELQCPTCNVIWPTCQPRQRGGQKEFIWGCSSDIRLLRVKLVVCHTVKFIAGLDKIPTLAVLFISLTTKYKMFCITLDCMALHFIPLPAVMNMVVGGENRNWATTGVGGWVGG